MKTTVLFLLAAAIAPNQHPTAASQVSCGPAAVQFEMKTDNTKHPLGDTQNGKALIYVIEDQQFRSAGGMTTRVAMDGNWVGANRGNSYFFFVADPGEHHLCVNGGRSSFGGPFEVRKFVGTTTSLTSFTAESGKVYYFRARVVERPDNLYSIDLEPINLDEGSHLITTSAFSTSQQKKK